MKIVIFVSEGSKTYMYIVGSNMLVNRALCFLFSIKSTPWYPEIDAFDPQTHLKCSFIKYLNPCF